MILASFANVEHSSTTAWACCQHADAAASALQNRER